MPTASKPAPSIFRGRLSLKVDTSVAQPAEATQAQFFSTGFELSGNPQAGELTLFTPLGGTVAALNWAPAVARLRANNEVRDFDSLAALLKHVTGTEIPVTGLFAWLAGTNVGVDGWLADLSQLPAGRLFAKRSQPLPALELRVILEN
jgi:outer membrane lipoprotein LolB